MLTRIRIKSFKSIEDASVELPRLTVLFGPNASGKSNFIEALQCLSRLVTKKTIDDALNEPIRGNPQEYLRFPPGGLAELFRMEKRTFELEADISPKFISTDGQIPDFIYRIKIGIIPKSGKISVDDEYLQHYTKKGRLSHHAPKIEKKGNQFVIRTSGAGGSRRFEDIGQIKTIASDRFYSGKLYRTFDYLRQEMSEWKTYYLDPRESMRLAIGPKEVDDIGYSGGNIAPFLNRVNIDKNNYFKAIERKIRTIIPSIDSIKVELNEKPGQLDIIINQDGISFSSRIVSEGTLRILALCAITMNPWSSSLVAFEEPENGVHPRRLELITNLLTSLALDMKKQVIITTHSPTFCKQIINKKRQFKDDIALIIVTRRQGSTVFRDFNPLPLLEDEDVKKALTSESEDGFIEDMIMRGFLDA